MTPVWMPTNNSSAASVARFLNTGIDRIFSASPGHHVQPISDHALGKAAPASSTSSTGHRPYGSRPCRLRRSLRVVLSPAGHHRHRHRRCVARARACAADQSLPPHIRRQHRPAPGQLPTSISCGQPFVPGVPSRTAGAGSARTRQAVSRAIGDAGGPGPAYVEIPPTYCGPQCTDYLSSTTRCRRKPLFPPIRPHCRRPSMCLADQRRSWITGRGARSRGYTYRLLDATAPLSRHPGSSRAGARRHQPPACGNCRRRGRCRVADRRQFGSQVGYRSPAVFPHTRFIGSPTIPRADPGDHRASQAARPTTRGWRLMPW